MPMNRSSKSEWSASKSSRTASSEANRRLHQRKTGRASCDCGGPSHRPTRSRRDRRISQWLSTSMTDTEAHPDGPGSRTRPSASPRSVSRAYLESTQAPSPGFRPILRHRSPIEVEGLGSTDLELVEVRMARFQQEVVLCWNHRRRYTQNGGLPCFDPSRADVPTRDGRRLSTPALR